MTIDFTLSMVAVHFVPHKCIDVDSVLLVLHHDVVPFHTFGHVEARCIEYDANFRTLVCSVILETPS